MRATTLAAVTLGVFASTSSALAQATVFSDGFEAGVACAWSAVAGIAEIRDNRDNDCDAVVDESLIPYGTILVTEIMQNPSAVPDANGEWFEVFNASDAPVNMESWVVLDTGTDSFLVAAPVEIPAFGLGVFCRDANPGTNGGVLCDYGYTDFLLANSTDEIALTRDSGELIDSVDYDSTLFPDPPPGHSISLDPAAFDAEANSLGSNWCIASDSQLPAGDYGSPGVMNPSCAGVPTIVAVVPDNGVDEGGEPVRLLGSGFTGTTAVTFGTGDCATWSVEEDGEIACVTPPHSAGSVDVTVEGGAATATAADGYRYTGESVLSIDWCELRGPAATTTGAGTATDPIVGRVHSPGVTEPEGPPAGIVAQVGYGPFGSDPRDQPGWRWLDADWSGQADGVDEFAHVLWVPQAGSYSLAYRFSDDGGLDFLYCDLDPGTTDGFSADDLGTLTVN